jgi:hypothetical protein
MIKYIALVFALCFTVEANADWYPRQSNNPCPSAYVQESGTAARYCTTETGLTHEEMLEELDLFCASYTGMAFLDGSYYPIEWSCSAQFHCLNGVVSLIEWYDCG